MALRPCVLQSAGGATSFSPARKRWVRAYKTRSTGGAARLSSLAEVPPPSPVPHTDTPFAHKPRPSISYRGHSRHWAHARKCCIGRFFLPTRRHTLRRRNKFTRTGGPQIQSCSVSIPARCNTRRRRTKFTRRGHCKLGGCPRFGF